MIDSLKIKMLLAAFTVLCLNIQTAQATCTCEVVNAASFIGMELTAKACPPENANDATRYVYIDRAISCSAGQVVLFSPWGDTQASPDWLQRYYTAQGMRVFRNADGTHFVVVHPNFKGRLNGLSMADFPGGGIYRQAAMEEQCVSRSQPVLDADGDGIPFCQDCDDANAAVGGGRDDQDGDGVPACLDCDDTDPTLKAGKGIDADGDGFDQCSDCNDLDPHQHARCQTCPVGRPVDYYSGAMTHDIELLNLPGAPVALSFTLHYDSHDPAEQPLGIGWSHSQAVRLAVSDKAVIVTDQTRKPPTFATYDQGATFYPSGATTGSLVKTDAGYTYTRADAHVLTFDRNGHLLERRDPHGLATTYAYDDAGRLVAITDPSARVLRLAYYPAGTPAQGLLMALQDPAGRLYRFGYAERRLATITYPDADDDASNDPVAHLFYSDFPDEQLSDGGDPDNLTKLVDTRGNALTWSYDDSDRAILTSGPQGTNHLALTYATDETTVIVNSQNEASTYTYDDTARTLTVTGPGCTSCSRSTVTRYSPSGKVIERVDGLGNITRYQDFDRNGNAGTVIEAAGTDQEKVTRYTYDPKFDKIAYRREKGAENIADRETLYGYDQATGDLLSVTRKGSSDGTPCTLTTTHTYNDRGEVVRIDGPRTDVPDVTTMTYDPVTGYRLSQTRLLAGTTRYADYDPLGYPGTVTDPNGNTIRYTYDRRGRLVRMVGPQGGVTTHAYDGEGNLVATTLASGASVTYAYDAANRLVLIQDAQGNQQRYLYDSEGNRVREEIRDKGGVLTKYIDYAYDAYNRLTKQIYPDGTFTAYEYDGNNNRTAVIDPAGRTTHYAYDAFNRLVEVTDPMSGVTRYAYDPNGNLSSVTDAAGHTTTYRYDDLGRRLSETSPDTGRRLYTYDAAGNQVKKMDARGLATTYAYDALNRLTAVHYPDATQDLHFSYDEGANGKGRLTGLRDASGAATCIYAPSGRPIKAIKVVSGVRYVTSYAYDVNGNLAALTYPDGQIVTYTYGADNRLSRVTAAVDHQSVDLASGIAFAPFGGITAMRLGNGIQTATTYDTRYRITGIQAGQFLNRQYAYDPSGSIDTIMDNLAAQNSQTFVYDGLNRLTGATGGYGAIAYTYDPVGNRTSLSKDAQTDTYAYTPGTNRLTGITGSVDKSFAYDKSGNLTRMDATTLVYNTADRLVQLIEDNAPKAEYVYNGRGQRVIKKHAGDADVYHYDLSGNLIAVSDRHGAIKEKFIYANGQRLAKIAVTHQALNVGDVDQNGRVEIHDAQLVEQYLVGLATLTQSQIAQADVTLDGKVTAPDAMTIKQVVNGLRPLPPGPAQETLYYYHNDHLGTPLALTDQDGVKVWQADYLPFGQVYKQTGTVVQAFRLPGQYYDSETGLHYNYYRYYDPKIGRYLRADPIGLNAGMDPYTYTNNKPINRIDRFGLDAFANPSSVLGDAARAPKNWPNFPGYTPPSLGQPELVLYMVGIAATECIKCTANCTLKQILPSTAQGLVITALLETAEGVAHEALRKAIPYYGWASAAVSVYGVASCSVNCVRNN